MALHEKTCNDRNENKSCSQVRKPSKHSWLWRFTPLSGLIALIWFLIRVVPKPSRATYPCQRVAAPLATGFVIWLLSIFGSIAAWTEAKHLLRQLRFRLAILFLVICGFAATVALVHTPVKTAVASPQPNVVLGTAKGLHPGRVVWVYAPSAAHWDGTSGYWWQPSNTNQEVVDNMMSAAIRQLAGVPDDANDNVAWQAIFRNFNIGKGKGNIGYGQGEKITIKVNLVTSNSTVMSVDANYNQVSDLEYVNTSPYMIVAILNQLVNQVGVSQENIWVGDTTSYFPNHYWNICHTAFPMVHYFDCGGKFGRDIAQPSNVRLYWSTSGAAGYQPDFVPACYKEAEYIIDFACLKTSAVGVTLCGKNHYGSLCRIPSDPSYYNLHLDLSWPPGTPGMGKYRPLVDLLGHSQIGQKTLLYLIDGLWGGYGSLRIVPPQKWNMPPFNGKWPSSLFASQDPVAIDSVGYDFLWAEDDASSTAFPYSQYHYAKTDGGDDYLHEAALADNPASGTFYDPDGSGTHLSSLGVHEHWNNSVDKQYSMNLGIGNGIELLRIDIEPNAISGDLDGDYRVDFVDFAMFASHWEFIDCSAVNEWCNGADINQSGSVSFSDLKVILDNWLTGF